MGLISPGVGSGLDVQGIVDKLVQADLMPAKTRLDRRDTGIHTQLSALGQVKGSLSKLQDTLTKLAELKQFYAFKTTTSDPDYLTTTITDKAFQGTYQIEVKQLAARQTLASTAFPSSTTPIGSGSMTITLGSYSEDSTTFTANPDSSAFTINIAPGQDSLLAIRDSINKSSANIQASIVQDDAGAHLMLASPKTGKSYAMKISVNDNDGNNSNNMGLSRLAYDPTQGINALNENVSAKDSQVVLNGLLLTQSTNQLENAIEGVTLDLKKAETGKILNLTISHDKAQLNVNVNEFIKQYNDSINTLNALTSYNKETKQAGLLQSDAGLRALKLSLSAWATEPLPNTDGLKSLSDIGIKTNSKGLLVLDNKLFDIAVTDHFDDIGKLFAKTATATDSSIQVKSVGKNIKAGQYNVELSTFTPGSALQGTIGQVSATSSDGITLTGSGNFSSLSINVLSGGIGNRGQIIVNDGLAIRLNDLIDSYQGADGNLTKRTEQLNKRSIEIDEERETLAAKMDTLQKRYYHQFSSLDILLSQLQSTSAYLSQQLSNLPDFTLRR